MTFLCCSSFQTHQCRRCPLNGLVFLAKRHPNELITRPFQRPLRGEEWTRWYAKHALLLRHPLTQRPIQPRHPTRRRRISSEGRLQPFRGDGRPQLGRNPREDEEASSRRRVVVLYGESRRGKRPSQQIALTSIRGVEVLVIRIVPLVRLVRPWQGSRQRLLNNGRGAELNVGKELMDGRYEVTGGDAPSHLPSRGAEGFPRGGDGDGAIPHVGEGCKVDVAPGGGGEAVDVVVLLLGRGVYDVLVHLVRDDDALRSRLLHVLRDGFHFREGEHLAGGIVWRVEYDRSRFGRHGALELFRFQYPRPSRDFIIVVVTVIVRHERQRNEHRRPTRQLDLIHVQIEKRLEQNNLIPRLDERLQTQVQRLTRPHRHGNLVHRIDIPPHVL
mmetsp:Transcript_23464/g.42124  ORF Transcript_23464/g.42124 Transcript_23464/m.42124 type:complete len:386 (-) Transcript_23464:956-2113(-)